MSNQKVQVFARHPLSALYPDLKGDVFESLKESIKSEGQKVPGVIFQDKILDGWQRYLACVEVGVDFLWEPLPDGANPKETVKALNNNRRHFETDENGSAAMQRTLMAMKIDELEIDLTPSPILTKNGGESSESVVSSDDGIPNTSDEDCCSATITVIGAPQQKKKKTISTIAKEEGVSEATVNRAVAVKKAGLGDKVISGEVSAGEALKKATGKARKKPKWQKQIDELTDQNEKFKDRYKVVNDENEHLKIEVAALGAANDTQVYDAVKEEMSTYDNKIKLLTESRDAALDEVGALRRQIKAMQKELKELRAFKAEVDKVNAQEERRLQEAT